MKKKSLFAVLFVLMILMANIAGAYNINDSIGDGIGSAEGFESYGINVYNYTPGTNSGNIGFSLYTDYPKTGISVAGWNTSVADLFIRETYYGNDYLWAIPLVSRPGFDAGTLYAVGSYKISDDFDPSPGSYIYNHGAMVQVDTVGNNYGWSSIGGGSVAWNDAGGTPNFEISVVTGVYQDDPNGKWSLYWATATCGNDIVQTSPAPIPGTLMLLGTGMIGMFAIGRRKGTSTAIN